MMPSINRVHYWIWKRTCLKAHNGSTPFHAEIRHCSSQFTVLERAFLIIISATLHCHSWALWQSAALNHQIYSTKHRNREQVSEMSVYYWHSLETTKIYLIISLLGCAGSAVAADRMWQETGASQTSQTQDFLIKSCLIRDYI